MPNSRELKALVLPLLKRRPDLAFHKRTIFFAPLTHYLRGVIFFQGWSSGDFTAHVFATPLFDGADDLHPGSLSEKAQRRFSETWRADPANASAELCDYLERQALPIVEPMVTPAEHEKLPQYIAGYSRGTPPLQSSLIRFIMASGACCNGEFDKAQGLLVGVAETRRRPVGPVTEDFRNHQDFFFRAAYLAELLHTDRSRVLPLLHEWKAAKVRHLGLGKFWTPTPFPCERATR